jgi:hypothetical protein
MENTGFRSESQPAAGSSQFAGSGQFKENSRGLERQALPFRIHWHAAGMPSPAPPTRQ